MIGACEMCGEGGITPYGGEVPSEFTALLQTDGNFMANLCMVCHRKVMQFLTNNKDTQVMRTCDIKIELVRVSMKGTGIDASGTLMNNAFLKIDELIAQSYDAKLRINLALNRFLKDKQGKEDDEN